MGNQTPIIGFSDAVKLASDSGCCSAYKTIIDKQRAEIDDLEERLNKSEDANRQLSVRNSRVFDYLTKYGFVSEETMSAVLYGVNTKLKMEAELAQIDEDLVRLRANREAV